MSDPSQYTVGWICALETEYVAARAFLEKRHSRPESLSPNDNNHYTLGEIGGHQVVIAVLPDGEYGTSTAAGVARDMVHSFPNIRFGLMVGIGGGVPTKHDIRLGDIVVSSSRNGRGGLLQYDFGKALQGQELYQTGHLNQPPPILRAAVSGLQAQYEEEGNQLKESVQTVLEGNKRLKRKYTQPPFETDRLHESQFVHPDPKASCGIKNRLDNVSKDIHELHSITTRSAREMDAMADSLDSKDLLVAEGAEFGTYADQYEEGCLSGTRTELLFDINEWAHSRKGKCMFWLNGLAGTGKSTISRTVAKNFQDQGLLGASFFFKRGLGDRGNATRFFPTIAKQLMNKIPELRAIILQTIRNNPGILVKPLKEQFHELFHQPLHNLNQPRSWASPLVIVIDALDECEPENDIKVLLQLLPHVQDSKSVRLRVFITSRPELPVKLGFQSTKNKYQDLVLHKVPTPIIERDISLFLDHKLAKIRKQRALPINWPGKSDIQALRTMSVPLFIFAATVCRVFEDHNLDPVQCLSEILRYKNQESKLDGTYLPILGRLASKYDGARKKRVIQDVQEVVGIIILLESPLSVVSLSKLMGISTMSITARLSSLHSVLNIPSDETLPVSLFHLSFRDFLLDSKSREKTPFWVNEKKMNQKLMSYCLSVMRSQLKKNICNLQSYGTERRSVNTQAINHHVPQELQYSCRYWVTHLARSKDPWSQYDEIRVFLEKHLLHWVEDHERSSISQLLQGAKRFVLKYGQIADIAPLQLYASGLMFAPRKSITRRIFESELPSWIYRGSSVEEIWTPELQTLEGHSGQIQSVAFSADGQLLASGSYDNSIKLWDPATGMCRYTLEGHSDNVKSVAFSADSRLLASGSYDHPIKLWDTATGTCQHTPEGQLKCTGLVAFSPSGRLLAFESPKCIKLWDMNTGTLNRTPKTHLDGLVSLAFSSDGRLLVSSSYDWTIKLWDTITATLKHTIKGYSSSDELADISGSVLAVAFSPDGQLLASTCDDFTVKLWDTATGMRKSTLKGHRQALLSVAFSADGRLLASGCCGSTIRLWDPATGICKYVLQGHSDRIMSLAFSPDSQVLASGSDDFTIKLWDLTTGTQEHTRKSHSRSVESVIFSPDGHHLASASLDGTIRLWDTATGTCKHTLKDHLDSPRYFAFISNGRWLVSCPNSSTMKLWDSTTGKCKLTLKDHNANDSIDISQDGRLMAYGSRKGPMRLWDFNTSACKHTLEGSGFVRSVAFSPDCQLLASISESYTIKIWDTATGKCKHIMKSRGHSLGSAAFSPNGQLLVSSSDDYMIMLWNPATGKCKHVLEGHSGRIRSLAFSPDSKLLASGSDDFTIKLWDPVTGAYKCTLNASDSVTNIEFSDNSAGLHTNLGYFNIYTRRANSSSDAYKTSIEECLRVEDRHAFMSGLATRAG
ncbi:WD domain protein [Penicillium fimorum]|uniref:WD domain protein n=1 Tax=Penicillium fimorum TaxID=1882269 RepID=A0A9X0CBD8_9EURO|nr:WD domain protein [Penicillium fimorum]